MDDDEQKIYEKLTQLNKSEQDQSRGTRAQPTAGKRAYPTAGENQKNQKSIPNSRGESEEQKEQCQLQAETYEKNNVSKKGVGPMTRDKDTESHQRMAAEQVLKVAEKAREHQVEIETEMEVEKQKAAELKNQVRNVKKSLEEQQHKAHDVSEGR